MASRSKLASRRAVTSVSPFLFRGQWPFQMRPLPASGILAQRRAELRHLLRIVFVQLKPALEEVGQGLVVVHVLLDLRLVGQEVLDAVVLQHPADDGRPFGETVMDLAPGSTVIHPGRDEDEQRPDDPDLVLVLAEPDVQVAEGELR